MPPRRGPPASSARICGRPRVLAPPEDARRRGPAGGPQRAHEDGRGGEAVGVVVAHDQHRAASRRKPASAVRKASRTAASGGMRRLGAPAPNARKPFLFSALRGASGHGRTPQKANTSEIGSVIVRRKAVEPKYCPIGRYGALSIASRWISAAMRLLRREVGRVEPGQAQRFQLRHVGPAEPGVRPVARAGRS